MSIVGIRDASSSKKDPGAPYKTKPIPQSHSPLQIPLYDLKYQKPGWQELRERANGIRRKIWTRTKILSPT